MNLEDSIKEIPNLIKALKEKFMEKVVEQKFMDVKLKDGTILSYEGDMPSVGIPLFVIDEKGERLPVPDGEHELEDGTIIVSSGGMIAEVKTVDVAPEGEEPMAEEGAAPQVGMTEDAVKRIVETVIKETVFANEEYVAKFEAIEKENIQLKADIEKANEFIKETFAIVEKIANAPSETPKPKKDGFMVEDKVYDREKEVKEFREKYLKNQF